ncbi:hypothetical protein ACFP81_10615 [Deinococcus lacus]|uniref:Uncharacterized protein n=1 Tax=Deinococcus lacus TaxID=392561 RepID=A0ABW1YH00_9DEIO
MTKVKSKVEFTRQMAEAAVRASENVQEQAAQAYRESPEGQAARQRFEELKKSLLTGKR